MQLGVRLHMLLRVVRKGKLKLLNLNMINYNIYNSLPFLCMNFNLPHFVCTNQNRKIEQELHTFLKCLMVMWNRILVPSSHFCRFPVLLVSNKRKLEGIYFSKKRIFRENSIWIWKHISRRSIKFCDFGKHSEGNVPKVVSKQILSKLIH